MAPLLEPIPPTLNNCHFPIGDLDDERAERRKWQELMKLQDATPGQRRQICTSLFWSGQDGLWLHDTATKAELLALFHAWSAALLPGEPEAYKRAWTCFNISVGFVRGLLPPLKAKFAEELAVMASYDARTIGWASNNAWTTMELSHRVLFAIMAPLCRLIAETYGARSREELQLVEAAMVLPYSMSAASRLIGYCAIETPTPAS
jgi:hypothetical protein